MIIHFTVQHIVMLYLPQNNKNPIPCMRFTSQGSKDCHAIFKMFHDIISVTYEGRSAKQVLTKLLRLTTNRKFNGLADWNTS